MSNSVKICPSINKHNYIIQFTKVIARTIENDLKACLKRNSACFLFQYDSEIFHHKTFK